MYFEGRRRSGRMPNLTPLIDVVFLLLVFFMLTSHFVTEKAINVDLPESGGGRPLDEVRRVEVVMDARGDVTLDGRVLKGQALEAALTAALQGNKDKVVRLRGDRRASLGNTVGVLDAASKAGADGVEILTEEK